MSEISREDCISRLDTMRSQLSVCLATHFGFGNNFKTMKSMCDKAISDMEKLEKIEQRISEFQNGTDMFDGMDEAYVVYAIEQIVKE